MPIAACVHTRTYIFLITFYFLHILVHPAACCLLPAARCHSSVSAICTQVHGSLQASKVWCVLKFFIHKNWAFICFIVHKIVFNFIIFIYITNMHTFNNNTILYIFIRKEWYKKSLWLKGNEHNAKIPKIPINEMCFDYVPNFTYP